MNTAKQKLRQDVKDTRIVNQLNNSLYALASHLYQYIDILRQSTARPGSK